MGRTATSLIAVALLLGSATAQMGRRCPRYQSTVNFDQAFVDKMTALNSGGYIVRFSNGAIDACQRLQFVDGNDHNITFIDAANFQQNYTNRYSYELATLSSPAYLKLRMPPRLLGANGNGRLTLYPLVAQDDLIVFVSCIEPSIQSFYRTEQVLVFSPYKTKDNLSDEQIKVILKQHDVPQFDKLKNISTNCIPPPPQASSPLAVDIYNLVSNIMNPFGGLSNVALTYGAPHQNPVEASEQLMRMFEEAGITPAQFYAQTGSTIIQNPSMSGAQVSYNSFQKVAGSARNPQHAYDPSMQAAGVVLNSHSYQNYNPAAPFQHIFQPNIPVHHNYHQNSIYQSPAQHATPYTSFGTHAAEQYASGNVQYHQNAGTPHATSTTYSAPQQTSKLHHHHDPHQTTKDTKLNPSATVYNAISQPSSVGLRYTPIKQVHAISPVQPIQPAATGAQQVYYQY